MLGLNLRLSPDRNTAAYGAFLFASLQVVLELFQINALLHAAFSLAITVNDEKIMFEIILKILRSLTNERPDELVLLVFLLVTGGLYRSNLSAHVVQHLPVLVFQILSTQNITTRIIF